MMKRTTLTLCTFLLLAGAPAGAETDAPGASGGGDRLLVLNKMEDTLMLIDPASGARLETVPVGAEPHEIAVRAGGGKAYVANAADRSLSVVDLATASVLRTLRPARADFPHGLAPVDDGDRLLVTSEGSHRFYLIDTARDVVIGSTTSTQEGMHLIALRRGGNEAYVANRGSGTVTVMSVNSLRIKRHIEVGDAPEGIAVTPDGRLLLVALSGADEVLVMKAGGDRILSRHPTGRIPIRIAVTPDSSRALVSNRGSDDVTIIDLGSDSAPARLDVGRSPGGLVVAPSGRTAYVCNNGSDSVSVISLADLRVVDEFRVGSHPDGIAYVAAPEADAAGTVRSRRSHRKRSAR